MNGERPLAKIFSWICILFPILFIYSTGIQSFTIADALLLACIVFLLFDILTKKKYYLSSNQLPAIICVIYMLIMIMLEFAWGYSLSVILKLVRYTLYFGTVALYSPLYIDINYFWKKYKLICTIASIYLIIQALLWNVFHYKLIGYIPFLNLTSNNSFQIAQYSALSIGTYRPCAFFLEPAHFSAYVIGCLGVLLYHDDLKWGVLLTIAIALSSSGTGIILTVLLWSVWLFVRYLPRMSIKRTVIILMLVLTGAYLVTHNSQVQLFISRTIQSDSAITGRFSGYSLVSSLYSGEPSYQKIFGIGMRDITSLPYLSGLAQWFLDFGIIGSLLLVMVVINTFRTRVKMKILMLSMFMILSVGTMALVSYLILIYFGFVFAGGRTFQYERTT